MAIRPESSTAVEYTSLHTIPGRDLIVLHSGEHDREEVWSRVRPLIDDQANVLTVHDAYQHIDQISRLRRSIETLIHVTDPKPRLVLAGWAGGIARVTELAGTRLAPVHGLVICSGATTLTPGGVDQKLSAHAAISTVMILPGASSELDKIQRERLHAFPHAREVIAGRSKDCPPRERPELVAEVILGLLQRQQ